MGNWTDKIASNFGNNVESVRKLMDFDKTLLQICLAQLRNTNEKIKSKKLTNLYFLDNAIASLENVRENGSLKIFYETIYNECVVLLVSFFASALKDLFQESTKICLTSGKSTKINKEEIKFQVDLLQGADFDIESYVCDTISNEISFQDMKSIRRNFKKFFECDMEVDETTNNIILAQAC